MSSDAERYKSVLSDIVKVASTPDGPIGTLPGGANGPTWRPGGREKALEEALRIARAALDVDEA